MRRSAELAGSLRTFSVSMRCDLTNVQMFPPSPICLGAAQHPPQIVIAVRYLTIWNMLDSLIGSFMSDVWFCARNGGHGDAGAARDAGCVQQHHYSTCPPDTWAGPGHDKHHRNAFLNHSSEVQPRVFNHLQIPNLNPDLTVVIMGCGSSKQEEEETGPWRQIRGNSDATGRLTAHVRRGHGRYLDSGDYGFSCNSRSVYVNNITVTCIDRNGVLTKQKTIRR